MENRASGDREPGLFSFICDFFLFSDESIREEGIETSGVEYYLTAKRQK